MSKENNPKPNQENQSGKDLIKEGRNIPLPNPNTNQEQNSGEGNSSNQSNDNKDKK